MPVAFDVDFNAMVSPVPRAFTSFSVVAIFALAQAACSSHPEEITETDHSPDTGASGFCRSTTCQPPRDYPTPGGLCEPLDWADSDVCVHDKKASNAPLWWRTGCVGYALQRAASHAISFDVFSGAVEAAFTTWVGASCPSTDKLVSRASIDARDLGAVSCTSAGYDREGPNENLIVFRDDVWPYEQRDRDESGLPKSPTVALTTVTFDPQTGEILDVDLELNSADYAIVPVDDTNRDAPGTYDLQAVLTHELGHFFGLAHSPLRDAVMYKSGDSTAGAKKRRLTQEDVRGICTIYPPDGTRSVSTLLDASGRIAASGCDPTPRHGFKGTCL